MQLTNKQKEEIKKLNLFDDFIFARIMKDTNICKHLLELILERKIERIEPVVYQKTIKVEPDAKAIRLDVYVKDVGEKVYNIELQVANKSNLAKRARYYAAMLDMDNTYVGEDYSRLRETYIIFISPFDIMGAGEYKYTFKTVCKENGKTLEDGLTKIFVNTKAKDKCENKELRELLAYMEDRGVDLETGYMQSIDRELRLILNNALKGEMEEMEVVSLSRYLDQLFYEKENKRLEEEIKAKKEALKTQNKELKAKKEELKTQNKELKAKKEELKTQNKELKAKKEEIKAQNKELEAKNIELAEQKNENIKNIKKMKKILESLGLPEAEIRLKMEEEFVNEKDILQSIFEEEK